MMDLYKYPHTPFLPWSPTIDDRVIDSNRNFYGKQVVVTEKMDGENTTMYRDFLHARSLDDDGHVSKDWVKNFWAQFRHLIPVDMHVCGENMYITHSIKYTNLASYFLGFSVWQRSVCLNWEDTLTFFEMCGIISVPVIYEGRYDEELIKNIPIRDGMEGYVVRNSGVFTMQSFGYNVAKCVRPHHVQTESRHWKYSTLYKNGLKAPSVRLGTDVSLSLR